MATMYFSETKRVMRQFATITNKKARTELEAVINDLYSKNFNAGEIIDILNKVMRVTLLNEGIEKD